VYYLSRWEALKGADSLVVRYTFSLFYFYPRLENRTKVTGKHANLIFEKLPDGDFQKTF
jgi:hypothetical protein